MTTRTIYEINGVSTNDTAVQSSFEAMDDLEMNFIKIEIQRSFTIEAGDIVIFKSGTGYDIFEGICQKITPFGSNNVIEVYSYEQELNEDIVEQTFTSQTFNTLANTLVTTYSSLTFVNATTQNPTIDEFTSKNKTPWQILRNIMQQKLINVTYEVNFSTKVLTIFERGQFNVSTAMINYSNCVIDKQWEVDISSQTTELKIVGNKQVRKNFVDQFNGDGSTASFTLTEIPTTLKVEVGGVEQELQRENTTAGDYIYSKETKTITFQAGSIPPSGTNNIVCTYDFELNLQVNHKADPSIITKYGTKQTKMVKNFLTTYDDLDQFANNYVDSFGTPLIRNQVQYFKTFDPASFIPGYQIQVTDTVNTVEGNTVDDFFIITKIIRKFPGGGLILEVGDKRISFLNYLKELDDNMKEVTEKDDNATITRDSQNIINAVDIGVGAEVELQLERDLPDNLLYFASEISGLLGWWKLNNNALDGSGNDNSGTWTGTEAYATGKQFALSGDFDGSSYITTTSGFTLTEGSFSLWVKADNSSDANEGRFLVKEVNSGFIFFQRSTSNQCRFFFRNSSGVDINTSVTLTDVTAWNLISVDFNATEMNIYVNNSLADTLSNTNSWSLDVSSIDIGGRSGRAFIGQVGDVRVYNSILTTNERTRLYNSGNGIVDNAIRETSAGALDTVYEYYSEEIWNSNPDNELSNQVSYYDLNGDSVDSVGSNDGVDTDISYVTGKIGNAAELNGSSSKIVADTSITGYPFTMMGWFNSDDVTTSQAILSLVDESTSDVYYALEIISSKIRVEARNTTSFVSDGTTTLVNGTWYHATVRFISATKRIVYINAVKEAIDEDSVAFNANVDKLLIGIVRNTSPTFYFDGKIDSVRIIAGDLTTHEIEEIYNEGNGRPEKYASYETIT